jgi:hypothetical protein
MGFVRFVVSSRHPESGVSAGLFELAYTLRDSSDVAVSDRESLQNSLEWFENHLSTPVRFNRSKSKGYDRRRTRGITWFRDNAAECIVKMHEIRRILEANGHPVTMIREERVGYVVYEDKFQVVAEPFAETQTDPD